MGVIEFATVSRQPPTPAPAPKLLLFRSIRSNLPQFILQHFEDQEDCLRQFFDLVVIGDADCDLDALCDRHRPDLMMFESGVYAGPRRIRNARTHAGIPRIGFCNADAYCPTRANFLADMDRWQVETFFTHSVSMPSYTPEIADRLFLWPNFVNPKRFPFDGRLADLPKDIPVLLTGSRASHYPWRNAVSRVLEQRFPATTAPHLGWFDARATAGMVTGDAYVQQLARSVFVPTCGSIAREAVRKHFEIPAAGACLITERTPAIEAAGFIDMENCVLADASDVLDKVNHLLAHPDELARITAAGQELVRRRHAMGARTQIADWLALRRRQRPGERIVQPDPFGPLVLAAGPAMPPRSDSRQIELIGQGFADIGRNALATARAGFTRSNNWHFTAEAGLGLATSYLAEGRPARAIEWVWRVIGNALAMHAMEPDPVEWATLVRALLCAGRLADARRHGALLPWVRHPELDRMRELVERLAGNPPPQLLDHAPRPSLHRLERRSDEAWRDAIVADLRRCGQARLADRAAAMPFAGAQSIEGEPDEEQVRDNLRRIERLLRAERFRPGAVAARLAMRTEGPPARNWPAALARAALKAARRKPSPFAGACATLAASADYEQIAFVHASARSVLVDAILAAAARNPNLDFQNPVAHGAGEIRPGARLFLIVKDELDDVRLLDRAEIVVLLGKARLADNRFVPAAPPGRAGIVLRRAAF